jgi:hypothetical protein
MEVIRDKVCEGRVLRERVQELRGQVLDLGNEKEALSREVHDLRAKNADLVVERANVSALVAGLEISKTAADRRIAELEGLLESCKKSKELAEGRLEEQNSIMEGLRLEIEKGCLLNGELKSAVKSLEGGSATARNLGLSAARQYASVLGAFGGITRELSEDSDVPDIMKWFASNFLGLKNFVTRAGDFAALSGVMNLLSLIEKKKCQPLEDFLMKDFAFLSPSELGEPSENVQLASRRFIKSFWELHGRAYARQLAEARRAQVFRFILLSVLFYIFSYMFLIFYFVF